MTASEQRLKRIFDVTVAAMALVLLSPVIAIGGAAARIDTGASAFFRQERVGRDGRWFSVVKLRTMRPVDGNTVTTLNDPRITRVGAFLRRWKIDELPQLWNVLKGDMSLVGPRPDVPGYLDRLEGESRILLSLRPGITGPATLHYRNEEALLATVDDPQVYNDTVIWPHKVQINMEYAANWSLRRDVECIIRTFIR